MSAFDIIGILLEPASKLLDHLSNRRITEEVSSELAKGLGNEIISYKEHIDKMYRVVNEDYIPSIEALSAEYSSTILNKILLAESQYIGLYAGLLDLHISIARSCKDLSGIKTFMNRLDQVDDVIFEFVYQMAETYQPNDKLKIQGKFYKFFQIKEDKLFEELSDDDIKNIIESLKNIVGKIKNLVTPTRSKAVIKRSIRRMYQKNIDYLVKTSKKISISKKVSKNLRKYVPKKLLPLTIFLDEIIDDYEKNKEKYYQDSRKKR